MGDPTAKERRRLSLNPLRHVDPFGTVVLPGLLAFAGAPVFGWAKPVPVTQGRLRNPRTGMMAVAAAGPLTNLVLAAAGAVVVGLLTRGGMPADASVAGYLVMAFSYFVAVNVFLAFFNLLPIPPFDGSHIVEGVLPRWRRVEEREQRSEQHEQHDAEDGEVFSESMRIRAHVGSSNGLGHGARSEMQDVDHSTMSNLSSLRPV